MTCLNYLFLDFFQYWKSQADSQTDSQAVFQAVFSLLDPTPGLSCCKANFWTESRSMVSWIVKSIFIAFIAITMDLGGRGNMGSCYSHKKMFTSTSYTSCANIHFAQLTFWSGNFFQAPCDQVGFSRQTNISLPPSLLPCQFICYSEELIQASGMDFPNLLKNIFFFRCTLPSIVKV